jgi:hypothetical protein
MTPKEREYRRAQLEAMDRWLEALHERSKLRFTLFSIGVSCVVITVFRAMVWAADYLLILLRLR